jgi:flap endonuclease-1
MGIKHLNRFIQSQCEHSIKHIHLSELNNKKIVIDTSIYLYKFASDSALLENFYLMISIFREHNIIPLFVFDGKPPKEKKDLLKQRKEDKKNAKEKYSEIKILMENTDNESDKLELIHQMDILKKDFVKINHKDIENVKLLLQAYGMSYVNAPGEADKLCAKIVSKNRAYACLSEDMDLFVYGCNRVMRYLSLLKKSAVMYDMKGILSELTLSLDEFKSICIVSGTDYNIHNSNANLHQSLKYFKKYKKDTKNIKHKEEYESNNFYEWLDTHTNYVNNIYELYTINDMFNLKHMDEYKSYEQFKIMNGPVNLSNLKTIMGKEDFIFVK